MEKTTAMCERPHSHFLKNEGLFFEMRRASTFFRMSYSAEFLLTEVKRLQDENLQVRANAFELASTVALLTAKLNAVAPIRLSVSGSAPGSGSAFTPFAASVPLTSNKPSETLPEDTSNYTAATESSSIKFSPISDPLCRFFGMPMGTSMSKSDVTARICKYARDNNLVLSKAIKADTSLRKLLNIPDNDELTPESLQMYLNQHYSR